MKQKLGPCCALILDAPATDVDPLSRRRFRDLIGRIRAERPGMNVPVSTARMEKAAGFDLLVAMSAVRVPAELLNRTGQRDLDRAFVALLAAATGAGTAPPAWPGPPSRRRGDPPLRQLPPRSGMSASASSAARSTASSAGMAAARPGR
ncbi:hypothetical protein [Poseidonocella sp. HB161398]|uniref:hypothetical protein n=1 Tax=Poseidonocella sp. HB161398 TaxID=2320855 RepID=UPI00197EEE1D|nr:hypothetical protein [Poseidonocella sp. HB161398]